jgi:alpha-L-fucosidase
MNAGGFALWPSNYTMYSVAASPWKNGTGDVLREFADAANRHGIKICYYFQAADDGWGMQHRHDIAKLPNYTATSFVEASLGKIREILTDYGPVNRFWCTLF